MQDRALKHVHSAYVHSPGFENLPYVKHTSLHVFRVLQGGFGPAGLWGLEFCRGISLHEHEPPNLNQPQAISAETRWPSMESIARQVPESREEMYPDGHGVKATEFLAR